MREFTRNVFLLLPLIIIMVTMQNCIEYGDLTLEGDFPDEKVCSQVLTTGHFLSSFSVPAPITEGAHLGVLLEINGERAFNSCDPQSYSFMDLPASDSRHFYANLYNTDYLFPSQNFYLHAAYYNCQQNTQHEVIFQGEIDRSMIESVADDHCDIQVDRQHLDLIE